MPVRSFGACRSRCRCPVSLTALYLCNLKYTTVTDQNGQAILSKASLRLARAPTPPWLRGPSHPARRCLRPSLRLRLRRRWLLRLRRLERRWQVHRRRLRSRPRSPPPSASRGDLAARGRHQGPTSGARGRPAACRTCAGNEHGRRTGRTCVEKVATPDRPRLTWRLTAPDPDRSSPTWP